jgi:hypothetical protein
MWVVLAGLLAGCSMGGNDGAASTPTGAGGYLGATYGMSGNHGGWIGQAAHYYDYGLKTCRKQTRAYVAQGKDPSLLTYLPATPDQFKEAAEEGCNVGTASVTDPSAPPMESIPAEEAKAIQQEAAKWLSQHAGGACKIVLSDRATCTAANGLATDIVRGSDTRTATTP